VPSIPSIGGDVGASISLGVSEASSIAAAASKKPSERGTSPPSKTPDPVGELRFKLTIDDAEIGRFSECTGLSVEYDVQTYPEGGENRYEHKLRGRLKYPNLVLKRGVTHEDALLKWFFKSQDADKRGSVTVTLLGPEGKAVRSFAFAGAFPVKWTGPNFNAGSNNVAMETLELAHQGLVVRS
jgi:phage tail-like protein